jgi:glycosyltransferase involved in cell wall biosynthesis
MAFLTIAIPTMDRWVFLKDSLPVYLNRPELGEIVICDENGNDIEEIRKSSFGSNPKLQMFTNENRLGIYHNKRKALSLASFPWVAVLDSDNQFSEEWFEGIADAVKKSSGKTVIGSPCFQSINITTGKCWKPCEHFAGRVFDKNSWNTLFTQLRWNHLLNDGNWVVPKGSHLCLPEIVPEGYKPAAEFCDALYSLRCFVGCGLKIWYPEDLSYNHLVHPGSSWLTRDAPSTKAINTTNWFL